MWESPIKVYEDVAREIVLEKENHIMQTIRQYVEVDKDELIRALQYDRNQYEKGFEDGYLKGRADFAEKILGMIEEFKNAD